MSTLIHLLIAAVVFVVIYFFLIPLLPAPFNVWFGALVVVIAIVYLLSELIGYWPHK